MTVSPRARYGAVAGRCPANGFTDDNCQQVRKPPRRPGGWANCGLL
jgi:hypothetical protein